MTQELLFKLQKVLALTESPVEGEAQAAAAKLQELLEKHNLQIADLEKRGQSAPSIINNEIDLGRAAFQWKLDLADVIAAHFYCASLTGRWGRMDRNKRVQFVGRPDNVESLGMLYRWLIDQIKRLSAEDRRAHYVRTNQHIDPLRWQVAYGRGVVSRMGDRLEKIMRRKQKDAARESRGAMVVHHQSEISDWLEEHHGYRTDGRKTAQQQRWQEEREEEERRMQALKKTDLAAYYRERPWEDPAEIARQAKKEARRQKRRERYVPRGFRWSAGDPVKEAEMATARHAGQDAASEINLEPFLTGGKVTIKTEKARRLRS